MKMRELLLRQGPCLLPVLSIAPSHWNTRALTGLPRPRVHGQQSASRDALRHLPLLLSFTVLPPCSSSTPVFSPSDLKLWIPGSSKSECSCVPSLLCECVLNNRTRDHCHRLEGTTDRGLSVYEDPDKVIFIYPGTRVC